MEYVGHNAANVLPYHLGAGLTAFGGVVLVDREGADGFLLLLVPVLLLQMSLLVLSARTHAAQLQREAHIREREQLLQQALDASDAERHRIARNLHDGVVQDLAAIALGLRSRADRDGEGDRVSMLHAADATAEAIEELRTLLHEIAPPDLQEVGFAAALDELAEPLRDEGVEVRIEVAPEAAGVRGAALTATYRIAQEALRNVAEHAAAHHVRVDRPVRRRPPGARDRRRRNRLLRGAAPAPGRGGASRPPPDPRPGARVRGAGCGSSRHPIRAPRCVPGSPSPRARRPRASAEGTARAAPTPESPTPDAAEGTPPRGLPSRSRRRPPWPASIALA